MPTKPPIMTIAKGGQKPVLSNSKGKKPHISQLLPEQARDRLGQYSAKLVQVGGNKPTIQNSQKAQKLKPFDF